MNKPNFKKAFLNGKAVSIQVQSILYNNDLSSIISSLESLARSAELTIETGIYSQVTVSYGDSSPVPCISDKELGLLQERFRDALNIKYEFFDGNLGSARGHNQLAKNNSADFLLIQNPDVVVSPRLLEHLIEPFNRPGVGMTEAKQLPIEHPKEYDPVTGETCWATTASAIIPVSLFNELNGFDADSFFLYCDDVDFSWRVRLGGYKVIMQASAVVFHDKRISDVGGWQPTNSERYYSAEAAMILAHKWSREDLADLILEQFKHSGDDHQKKAAVEFERRRTNLSLAPQHDPDHKIAQFINGFYAKHRYAL